jgi:hypothetical protein
LLPVVLAVAAFLTLLLAWQWGHKRDSRGPAEVNARTARVARATPAPQPVSAPTVAWATEPEPASQPDSPSSPAAVATEAATAATDEPLADVQEDEVTDTAAMTPPPPPKPAPLRLQAIVFNPRRPSAMISGKTLFVGDKLGALRVVAIDKDSATLVGVGQTNVLSLPE